jgi:hypothetical protein
MIISRFLKHLQCGRDPMMPLDDVIGLNRIHHAANLSARFVEGVSASDHFFLELIDQSGVTQANLGSTNSRKGHVSTSVKPAAKSRQQIDLHFRNQRLTVAHQRGPQRHRHIERTGQLVAACDHELAAFLLGGDGRLSGQAL